jgi:hypothetical protein
VTDDALDRFMRSAANVRAAHAAMRSAAADLRADRLRARADQLADLRKAGTCENPDDDETNDDETETT